MTDGDSLADALDNQPFLRRLLRSLTRDGATRDDVVQETLIAANKFKANSKGLTPPWLATVRSSNCDQGGEETPRLQKMQYRYLYHFTIPLD